MDIVLIGFVVLLVLVFLRLPIAFAMGIVGFVGFGYLSGWQPSLSMVGTLVSETALSYGLSVVPLFILMGNLVSRAGLSGELYGASHAFLGHRRGGLSMATIVACGGFSAICGSSLATAATMSKVAMPPMRRYGYSDSLASASIAAGGTLGILIPPSVILVIYGLMTETSIRELFAAGFIPGLFGIVLYLAAVQWVVVVPLGVRLPPAGPHPAPGSPYVLALGSADRRKDLTTLVAAFDALASEHRDLRLVHAGPDGDASDDLAGAIDRSPHRDRIERLGWVDDGARAALIEQAAAVAYPSLYEGFGLVPLEAMSAGRPVVTTRAPAIPEAAGDAAVYVDAGDADALAGSLQQVLTDRELAADLGARGRARAAGYTWERTADGLVELYRRATSEI